MAVKRPLALRRRDLHTVAIVSGIAVCNIAVFALFCANVRRLKHYRDDCAEAIRMATVCRDVSVECVSNVVQYLTVVGGAGGGACVDAVAPVVLGYGTTKSDAALYRYRDVRSADGTVHREYLSREPFQSEKPNTAYLDLLRFLQARRFRGATNNVGNAQQSSPPETMLEPTNTDSGNADESLPSETMFAPTNNVCDGDKNLTRQILLSPPNVPRGTRVATDYRL